MDPTQSKIMSPPISTRNLHFGHHNTRLHHTKNLTSVCCNSKHPRFNQLLRNNPGSDQQRPIQCFKAQILAGHQRPNWCNRTTESTERPTCKTDTSNKYHQNCTKRPKDSHGLKFKAGTKSKSGTPNWRPMHHGPNNHACSPAVHQLSSKAAWRSLVKGSTQTCTICNKPAASMPISMRL